MYARVLVMTLEGQDPHKLMEPFATDDLEDPGRGPYSVWFNMTEEWKEFYETWVFEGVILEDGRELPLMDPKYQELKNPEQYPRYRRLCRENIRHLRILWTAGGAVKVPMNRENMVTG